MYALPVPVEGTEIRAAFRITETAVILGCSERTVRRLLEAGRLVAVSLTPELRVIPAWSIESLLHPLEVVA